MQAPTETELADRIKTCIAEIEKASGNVLDRAIEAGELLIQAKSKVDHGIWKAWLNANCELSERTAQRYMKLARERSKLWEIMKDKNATMADLTLAEAERLLGDDSEGPANASDTGGESTTDHPTGKRRKRSRDTPPTVAYDNAKKKLLEKL